MFQRAMLLALVFVLSVADSSNEMASFTVSHSIHEGQSWIYYFGLGKKEENLRVSVFLFIELVSYLTLILYSSCLFTTEIFRRLLNGISFSLFIWRHQFRIGLSRKLLSKNTS